MFGITFFFYNKHLSQTEHLNTIIPISSDLERGQKTVTDEFLYINVPWPCLTTQMIELWHPAVWSASCADTRTPKTEPCSCCATSPAEMKNAKILLKFKYSSVIKIRLSNECTDTAAHTTWFISDLLTHCSLHRDFFSTGSPMEPFGRSLSILSTYNDTQDLVH